VNTMEQHKIHRRLVEAGVAVITDTAVVHHERDTARLTCAYTGRERDIAADAIVSVTFRLPDDSLVGALQTLGFVNVQAIGDAWSPGTIAEAVYSGRLYAEELHAPARPSGEVPFRREVIQLA
jgi:dimethylamine/trimethylamine dehydrogenase